MSKNLFCFWTDDNLMPNNRKKALLSLVNTCLDVKFINKDNLSSWILKKHPLHPAYPYLSAIHRADYLRVYFLHYYGGAYSDIKYINQPWIDAWDMLYTTDKIGIGYREVGPRGVAKSISMNYLILLKSWRNLLGNGAYIFKRNTEFTTEWINKTHLVLDEKLPNLILYPAQSPEDYFGRMIIGKIRSKYPLRWSELLGNVFHPLCLKYSSNLLYDLPAPDFKINYDI